MNLFRKTDSPKLVNERRKKISGWLHLNGTNSVSFDVMALRGALWTRVYYLWSTFSKDIVRHFQFKQTTEDFSIVLLQIDSFLVHNIFPEQKELIVHDKKTQFFQTRLAHYTNYPDWIIYYQNQETIQQRLSILKSLQHPPQAKGFQVLNFHICKSMADYRLNILKSISYNETRL